MFPVIKMKLQKTNALMLIYVFNIYSSESLNPYIFIYGKVITLECIQVGSMQN